MENPDLWSTWTNYTRITSFNSIIWNILLAYTQISSWVCNLFSLMQVSAVQTLNLYSLKIIFVSSNEIFMIKANSMFSFVNEIVVISLHLMPTEINIHAIFSRILSKRNFSMLISSSVRYNDLIFFDYICWMKITYPYIRLIYKMNFCNWMKKVNGNAKNRCMDLSEK